MTEAGSSGSLAVRAALLVGLARHEIGRALGIKKPLPRVPAECESWLDAPAATFVTLERAGRLRGCIGSLEASRSLREDVVENARAAALEDPRFPPLTPEEFDDLTIEVSLLAPPEPIDCASEPELLEALRPGVDGLVLACGSHRATFLPQVWEDLPAPADFLAALRRKARLAPGFWSDEIRFWRYTVEKHALE